MFLQFPKGREVEQIAAFELPDDVEGYNKLLLDKRKTVVRTKEKTLPGIPATEFGSAEPSRLLVMVFYRMVNEGDL